MGMGFLILDSSYAPLPSVESYSMLVSYVLRNISTCF